MTRSGGDFQPRPLKRLFTMSRYKKTTMQREKPPEWWEKQKGSRGIRRGQRYRLVFQFPIREHNLQFGIQRTCHHKCFYTT